MRGVILFGPPAAGKDTITRALHEYDPKYRLFLRLKAGPGRTAGYRMTTHEAIDALRIAGDIVWENRRYEAVYVVDRTELRARLADQVPVLHLGQVDAIDAVTASAPEATWLIVYVWCPREVAEGRIRSRATGDTAARLRAWDETGSPRKAHLTLNTAEVSAVEAARQIDTAWTSYCPHDVSEPTDSAFADRFK